MERQTSTPEDEETVALKREAAPVSGRRPRQGSVDWSPFGPSSSSGSEASEFRAPEVPPVPDFAPETPVPSTGARPEELAPGAYDSGPGPVPGSPAEDVGVRRGAVREEVWNPEEKPVSPPPPVTPQEVVPAREPAAEDEFSVPSSKDLMAAFPDSGGFLEPTQVTADDFARRRVVPPRAPLAEVGWRVWANRLSMGALNLGPGMRERARIQSVEKVRRNFGGLRQVTVVNPKGGAGKTVAALMLAMTFGRHRGGYVLAWDNNETQGTLGMRAQQDFHLRTVRDLLRDLDHFRGPTGRVGDLSQYVRAQGGAMFDVLASDESATAGEMLTARSFGDIREAVSRFYKLIVVDTGNNVRAANWQAAMDATDQLVVTMSARNDSAETAARMLDHLEQSGRRELVRQAVTVVSMPVHRRDVDLPAVQRHFSARTRVVLLAPYEKLIDSGEPIRYESLSKASSNAWLRIGASVAEGL